MDNQFVYTIEMNKFYFSENQHNRRVFSENFINLAKNNSDFLYNLIMGDDVKFYLNGFIGSRDGRRAYGQVLGKEVPNKPLNSYEDGDYQIVWLGLSANHVYCNFFDGEFYDETYQKMLTEYVRGEIGRFADLSKAWWLQNAQDTHRDKTTIKVLQEIFDNRIISQGIWSYSPDPPDFEVKIEFDFPSYSHDLNAASFFLLGYLKDKVYSKQPKTVQELKEFIKTEVQNLNAQPELLKTVMDLTLERVKQCNELKGKHLENVKVTN